MDTIKKHFRRNAHYLLILLLLPLSAGAANTGQHPYYLHALSDLRAARAAIQERQGGGEAVKGQERTALNEITGAIQDIKQASIDDGKNVNENTAVDVPGDHPGALHKAEELLTKARTDVAKEEDDTATRGLQKKTIAHLDTALNAVKSAIHDVENQRG